MLNYSKIRNALVEKKISQTRMAELIGMTREGYGRMIKDESMKVSTLEKIADVLGLPIIYFFEKVLPDKNGAKEYQVSTKITTQDEESQIVYDLRETIKYNQLHLDTQKEVIDKLKGDIKVLKIKLARELGITVEALGEKLHNH
jgi:transcriptional regulator with XRE-family HTH domain